MTVPAVEVLTSNAMPMDGSVHDTAANVIVTTLDPFRALVPVPPCPADVVTWLTAKIRRNRAASEFSGFPSTPENVTCSMFSLVMETWRMCSLSMITIVVVHVASLSYTLSTVRTQAKPRSEHTEWNLTVAISDAISVSQSALTRPRLEFIWGNRLDAGRRGPLLVTVHVILDLDRGATSVMSIPFDWFFGLLVFILLPYEKCVQHVTNRKFHFKVGVSFSSILNKQTDRSARTSSLMSPLRPRV